MSVATSIEWTDATWNPVRGCSRVSPGCERCYAERVAARFTDGAFHGFARMTKGGPRWTGKVALYPEKLEEPLHWKQPRRVFVNSMSDLFHESLPDEAIDQVFAVMLSAPRHTFQVLTKRPERMRRYMDASYVPGGVLVAGGQRVLDSSEADPQTWPPRNVWLGVSAEDQRRADERIPLLLQTPAAVRFVSYEPALWWVDFSNWLPGRHRISPREIGPCVDHHCLDWVIVGGESGPESRPADVAWIRGAVQQCRASGVPVFVKQLGAKVSHTVAAGIGQMPVPTRLRLQNRKGGNPAEWPEDLRVREFPRAG